MANIYQQVQHHYSTLAKNSSTEKYVQTVAEAFGYTREELASIPEQANLGLSCGNPLALAHLKEGETVVDLGSGAGLDLFLAAKTVGPNGRLIGIDMNKDMLAKANLIKEKNNATNVCFVESKITQIALPESIADCIISNCVVNLVPEPEKQLVFAEMFRLLKPGGRVAISDILVKKPLTSEMAEDMALYVGCIAGASKVGQYETYLRTAGFQDLLIVDNKYDLNVYKGSIGESDTNDSGCCAAENPRPCCQKSYDDDDENVDEKKKQEKRAPSDYNEWAGKWIANTDHQ